MTYFKDNLNTTKTFLFNVILKLNKTASYLFNKCVYSLQFSDEPYIINQHKKEMDIINQKLISSRSRSFL